MRKPVMVVMLVVVLGRRFSADRSTDVVKVDHDPWRCGVTGKGGE
ncbi:MAG: hypothetical protein ACRDSP_18115 [Pseudonocardiaceae bacterium]